jgi:hypothetical protein
MRNAKVASASCDDVTTHTDTVDDATLQCRSSLEADPGGDVDTKSCISFIHGPLGGGSRSCLGR